MFLFDFAVRVCDGVGDGGTCSVGAVISESVCRFFNFNLSSVYLSGFNLLFGLLTHHDTCRSFYLVCLYVAFSVAFSVLLYLLFLSPLLV